MGETEERDHAEQNVVMDLPSSRALGRVRRDQYFAVP
jgi:hypothetical protein